ncbi:MAG: YbhB/YbcL family Raf kinase inhibitor-like protein, partial [Candidatus Sericytochromatia bacterium]
MLLHSPAWQAGDSIPIRYTRRGANLSPPLSWSELPTGTAALALICTDPDASRLWYHWLLWNIPLAWPGLPEHLPQLHEFQGLGQGMTSYHSLGYDGPDPPAGETHRYFFRLYALDRLLRLSAGVPGPQLERAMAGKILAQAE